MTALLILLGLIVLAIGVIAFLIRDRLVSWEEEVPLNTGETIIVKRTMPWELVWGWGSDPVLRGVHSRQTLEFLYKGRSYSYSGGADIGWIAISPNTTPNLVAVASNLSWADRNKYYCGNSFYVQFKPSAGGKSWTWLKQMEPWLDGSPYNLMAKTDEAFDKPTGLISAEERRRRDDSWTRDPHMTYGVRIDADLKWTDCIEDPTTYTFKNPNRSEK